MKEVEEEDDDYEGFTSDDRYGKPVSLNRTLQTLIQGLPQEIITMHNQVHNQHLLCLSLISIQLI